MEEQAGTGPGTRTTGGAGAASATGTGPASAPIGGTAGRIVPPEDPGVPAEPAGRADGHDPADAREVTAQNAPVAAGGAPAARTHGTPPAVGDPRLGEPEDRPLDAEKLLRIASLAGQVLEEARRMEITNEDTAKKLAALHTRVTDQLYEALPNVLADELRAMDLQQPFADGATGQDVRIAYSALIGWLGGLLQGLQAAMQMAHMQQLQQARRNVAIPPAVPGRGTGQYL